MLIWARLKPRKFYDRSEEHTSELQSRQYLVCRLLLEKKKKANIRTSHSLTWTPCCPWIWPLQSHSSPPSSRSTSSASCRHTTRSTHSSLESCAHNSSF